MEIDRALLLYFIIGWKIRTTCVRTGVATLARGRDRTYVILETLFHEWLFFRLDYGDRGSYCLPLFYFQTKPYRIVRSPCVRTRCVFSRVIFHPLKNVVAQSFVRSRRPREYIVFPTRIYTYTHTTTNGCMYYI